jgi:outer membrane protein insertion porin family
MQSKSSFKRGWLFVLLATFASLLNSGADIVKDIKVQYIGPESVAESRILANVSTKIGDTLDEAVIEKDIKSLYASGDVENVRMFAEPYSGGSRLIILVETRAPLGEISFTGNSAIDDDKLRREVELAIGTSFDDTQLEVARQAIYDLYTKKKFTDINVTYKTSAGTSGAFSNVTFIIDEGEKSALNDIEFVGVTVFEPKELEAVMMTKERTLLRIFSKAGRIDNLTLEEDIARIESRYKAKGYLNARVTDVDRRRVNEKKVDLVITVDEGQSYDVGRVSLEGVSLYSADDFTSRFQLTGGQRFDGDAMESDLTMLKDHYGQRGYADVRAIPRITSAGGNTINVEYLVSEGTKSNIGEITIKGNDRTQDKVIRRELSINPGEEFNTSALRVSQNRLRNMGYFDAVDVDVVETGIPGHKDVEISVREKSTGTINFGAGFSSIDNLVGFVDVIQTNFDAKGFPRFTGAGQKFRMGIKYGSQRKDFVMSVTEPWFADQRLSLTGEVFYHEYRFLSDYYDQRQYGVEISLTRPMGEYSRLKAFYKPQQWEVYRLAADASEELKSEEGKYLEHLVGLTYSVDTRDDVLLPRTGFTSSFGVNVAFGDIETYGLEFKGSKHVLLPFDTILNIEGSFKATDNYSGNRVPIVERNFMGGSNDLKGFEYRDIGPRDENGEALGGRTAAFISAEYTVPIMNKVRLAAFTDWGTVSADFADIGDIYGDAGLGLRLYLPLGLIRLDYASVIQGDEFTGSGRFNFGMGAKF